MRVCQGIELLLWIAQHADAMTDVAGNVITLAGEVVADMPIATPEQFQRKLEATQRLLALSNGFKQLRESARKIERGLNKGEIDGVQG